MSGGSGPHSTPLRKSGSKKPDSDGHTTSAPPSQDQLKRIMRGEVGKQAWEFDATRISRILSPKKPKQGKTGADLQKLDNYDCRVEEAEFKGALGSAEKNLETIFSANWPSSEAEPLHYAPLVNFLNSCVEHGGNALTAVNLRGSWYQGLNFVKYDKETGDGVGGAHPLKPDIAGGIHLKDAGATLYWSPPDPLPDDSADKPEQRQVQLPVEVKKNWAEMVSQAATYARCLFSANPSRTFAIALAYRHTERQFRCLIFHRGGLTAQRVADLRTPSGRAAVLRIIMTMLLWSEPQHAGFTSATDDFDFLVPKFPDQKESIQASIQEVLHNSICVRGRATRVFRLSCRSQSSDSAVLAAPVDLQPKTQVQAPIVRRSPRIISQAASNTAAVTNPSQPKSQTRKSQSRSQPGSQPGSQPRSQPTQSKVRSNTGKDEVPGTISQTGGQYTSIHPRWNDPKHKLEWSSPTKYKSGKTHFREEQDIVVKVSWQMDSRKATESAMYAAADGSFGTPAFLCSYEGTHPNGEPISNHLLLPNGEAESTASRWLLFRDDEGMELPETRTMCVAIFANVGRSLVTAKSSYDLCMALVHALLGWLSFFQKGFMHRDISIGNVLLNEDDWQSNNMFKIEGDFLTAVRSQSISDALGKMTLTESEPLVSAEEAANQIMSLVHALGIEGKCSAFVTDGDMAADLETYFDEHRSSTRSGTPEFMSLPLHRAMLRDEPHLQSPIDDIESFFWLALWATLFNRHNPSSTRSKTEKEWQQWLDGADYKDKSTFTVELRRTQGSLSSITQELRPLLHKWWLLQEELRSQWDETIQRDRKEGRKGTDAEFYLPHFRHFALLGVRDFLNLVVDHLAKLRTYPKFTD